MKRETGYYWVKYNGGWKIAKYYQKENFFEIGELLVCFYENELEEINEQRIKAPNEQ